MIYLDNAATTFPKPDEVYAELDQANRNAFNTGRGSYKCAREASAIKEKVRQEILDLNRMNNGNVIYTSSATEALNDIIFGIDIVEGDYIYVSPFEHNSIIRPLEQLKKTKKINVEILSFDKDSWMPDFSKINDQFVMHKPAAIFLSQVSNVTGYIIPYEKIFEKKKKFDAINVLDASQGFGIIPIKNHIAINYVVFAGHKSLYASFGIAGFIKLKDDLLNTNIFGGTGSDTMNPNMPDNIPDKYEAGSPNIVGIRGLAASIRWLKAQNIYEHEIELTQYLIDNLKKVKKVKLFLPPGEKNIFGIVSIAIEGYSSDEAGMILDDEFDICVRTGYHCAPLVHDFIDSLVYNGTVRISISFFTTKKEIDLLIEALNSL